MTKITNQTNGLVTHKLVVTDAKGNKLRHFECYSNDDALRMMRAMYRLLKWDLRIDVSFSVVDIAKEQQKQAKAEIKAKEQETRNKEQVAVVKQATPDLTKLTDLISKNFENFSARLDAIEQMKNTQHAQLSKIDEELKELKEARDEKLAFEMLQDLKKLKAK